MSYEDRLEALRKEYREKPWKREIILRQVRALKIAMGIDKES